MKKFLVPVLASLCVLACAGRAHATVLTIGCTTNDYGLEGATCTVDECVDTGDYGTIPGNQFISFTPDFAVVDPEWMPGYFFIVDSSYDPMNPTVGIKDVIVIAHTAAGPYADPANGGQINVYTHNYAGMEDGLYQDFDDVVSAVLDGSFQVLDGVGNYVAVGDGQQTAGTTLDPFSSNRIGYFFDSPNAITIPLFSNPLHDNPDYLVFTTELACCDPGGGVTSVVPEPATLTLVGIGSGIAAIRRRRKPSR